MVLVFDACKQLSHIENVNSDGLVVNGDGLMVNGDGLVVTRDSVTKPSIVDTLVLTIDTLEKQQPAFVVQDSILNDSVLRLRSATTQSTNHTVT